MHESVLYKIYTASIALIFAACGAAPVDPEIPFVIEGELENWGKAQYVVISETDANNLATFIAKDTIKNGKFRFEEKMEVFPKRLHLTVLPSRLDGYPSTYRVIYVEPGAHVKVRGHNTHLFTWEVESDVPEQKAYDELRKVTREEDEIRQDLDIKYVRLSNKIDSIRKLANESGNPKPFLAEYKVLVDQSHVLFNQTDSLSMKIDSLILQKMRKVKPSVPYMDELKTISRMVLVRYGKLKKDAVEIYNSLPTEWKNTPLGNEIRANLNPPTQVVDGDAYPDATFYDLQGKIHHIAEYQGKYILLDFWSSSCAPCIKAFPQMKEFYEKCQDRLTIISMSIDNEKSWRTASERHNITWNNWNELKGKGGLFTNYRISAIPYYVLINPEGKVEEQIRGFSENYFTELFAELLGE